MRRTSIGSRWNTPGHRYAGGWRQNPWINAMYSAVHARNEAGDSFTASLDTDSAADREAAGQTRSGAPQRRDNQEQRAAVRTWENEGGSLGPHLT